MNSRTEYTIKRLHAFDSIKIMLITLVTALLTSVVTINILLTKYPIEDTEAAVVGKFAFCSAGFILLWIPMFIIGMIIAGQRNREREEVFYNNPSLMDKYTLSDSEKRITDSERKLIKKTYIKSRLGILFLIALLPVFAVGGIGMILMDFSLGGHTNQNCLILTWIGTLAFCIAGLICTYFSCKMTNIGDRWDKILQKASPSAEHIPLEEERSLSISEAAAAGRMVKRAGYEQTGAMIEIAAGLSAGSFLIAQLLAIAEQAKSLSGTFGIKLPNMKRIGIIMVVLLCSVVCAAISHDWNTNSADKQEKEAVVTRRIKEIDKVFVLNHGRTHHMDASKDHPTDVRAYLDEDGYDAYVSFSVQPTGEIDQVVYTFKADMSLSKEEALSKIEKHYKAFEKRLVKIQMDKKLQKNYPLTEEFKADFLENDEWSTLISKEDYGNSDYIMPEYYTLKENKSIKAEAHFEVEARDDPEGILWIYVKLKKY